MCRAQTQKSMIFAESSEQGKHTKEFSVLGLNAFNDIARRLEMCLPVYESRAHKIPHGLCFFIWAFLIFFGNSKTFFETKHHWTLKVVQTHIFCRITKQKGWKVCRGPLQDCIYVCIWMLYNIQTLYNCTSVQGLQCCIIYRQCICVPSPTLC